MWDKQHLAKEEPQKPESQMNSKASVDFFFFFVQEEEITV
jgi:hypothetical protein